jgi:hypothetical protein
MQPALLYTGIRRNNIVQQTTFSASEKPNYLWRDCRFPGRRVWRWLFWEVALCILIETDQRFESVYFLQHQDLIALTMQAVSTSEKSVIFHQTRRRNNPEDSHCHTRRCERLISQWPEISSLKQSVPSSRFVNTYCSQSWRNKWRFMTLRWSCRTEYRHSFINRCVTLEISEYPSLTLIRNGS